MRRRGPGWWLAAGLGVLSVGLAVWAQDATEVQEVTGFRVPEYDEQGNLKAQLFGDFARVLPDGLIEITGLKMERFQDGEVEVRITAPQCTYDRRANKGGSDSEVRIAGSNMVVTGKGFFYNGREEKFQIFSAAKVVLRDVRRKVESDGKQDTGAE